MYALEFHPEPHIHYGLVLFIVWYIVFSKGTKHRISKSETYHHTLSINSKVDFQHHLYNLERLWEYLSLFSKFITCNIFRWGGVGWVVVVGGLTNLMQCSNKP